MHFPHVEFSHPIFSEKKNPLETTLTDITTYFGIIIPVRTFKAKPVVQTKFWDIHNSSLVAVKYVHVYLWYWGRSWLSECCPRHGYFGRVLNWALHLYKCTTWCRCFFSCTNFQMRLQLSPVYLMLQFFHYESCIYVVLVVDTKTSLVDPSGGSTDSSSGGEYMALLLGWFAVWFIYLLIFCCCSHYFVTIHCLCQRI